MRGDFFYAAVGEEYDFCSLTPISPDLEKEIFGEDIMKEVEKPLYKLCEAEKSIKEKFFGLEEAYDAPVGQMQNPYVEDIPNGRVIDITEAIQIAKDVGWTDVAPTGKIKSDGGSTAYYALTIKTKDSDGNPTEFKCQVGDVIRAMVGNDFDLGNAVKAIRRIYCDAQGYGKEGIDMSYDKNKISYFVNEFVENNKCA